ncbi:DNA polymerase I [Actinocorallia sp. B10E7]|uniref:DNA polymerase I n=1 Tax=Actinocorallia sp. B10E7 TaxID=3153558 RepID=UPI00325E282D
MATSEPTPQTLLLLDGHSLAYRAFYALPVENFSTTTGQHTNAVFGFTSMLVNVLRDEKPSHVAVCFDRSEPTFRHTAYSEYKAGRVKTPDEFRSQVQLICEMLDALKITHLSVSGFEADDLIATLATRASAQDMRTLIVTGDRDAFQLVDENVTVLYPVKGVSVLARMDPEAVTAKYGVPPARYRELAALVGETSDNLPGVPGVGPKTAAKWLLAHDGLDNLVAQVDKIKGKAGDNLREHLGQVLRNQQINKLDCDVPLEADPAALNIGEWDRQEIQSLLDTLEFRGELRERLFNTLSEHAGDEAAESGEGFTVELTRITEGGLSAWLDAHGREGRTGVAVSGRWGRGTGELTAVALASPAGAAVHFDPALLSPEDERAFTGWLADPSAPKAMHDAKGPTLALAARGLTLAGLTSDTALACYLVAPDQRSYELGEQVLRFLHKELREEAEQTGQLTLDGADEDTAAQDLAVRARAVVDLAAELDAELERRGADRLLHELELPLIDILSRMERAGIAIDHDHLAGLSASLGGQAKEVEQGAFDAVGHEFNLGSPKQVQQVLFDELGLPKTKRTKTGYTTDSEALTGLLEKSAHPVLERILRWREVAKLKSMVDSLIPLADETGRIHTTFNQTVAATGRLSSTDPNVQNIPARTEEGRQIRAAFTVGEGYDCLLTADYSQIELRIMAHLSGDEALIEAFVSGADFHTITAAKVFGLEPEQITHELRSKIKAMNYGLAYGLSEYGLSQQLRITPAEARALKEGYFEVFGGVRDYLASVVAEARGDGYTSTILGRRRYLPDLNSDNRQRREMAERMALNAPIQGSAADIIKVAMIRIDSALREAGLKSRMLLQVHDELIFEVCSEELEVLKELVRTEMDGAYRLRAPLAVAMGTGRTWYDAAH